MKNGVLQLLISVSLLFGVPAVTFADNSGWYLGFSMGNAEVETINESDLGYKFYGGYQVQNIGVEFAFVGLGDGYTSEKVDIYGMSVEFIGSIPLGTSFSLLGKFGLFWWTVDNCYIGYYYYDCTGGYYDDGADLTYGVGVQFEINRSFSLRAEWEEFRDVSDSDVSLISAGIVYRF